MNILYNILIWREDKKWRNVKLPLLSIYELVQRNLPLLTSRDSVFHIHSYSCVSEICVWFVFSIFWRLPQLWHQDKAVSFACEPVPSRHIGTNVVWAQGKHLIVADRCCGWTSGWSQWTQQILLSCCKDIYFLFYFLFQPHSCSVLYHMSLMFRKVFDVTNISRHVWL